MISKRTMRIPIQTHVISKILFVGVWRRFKISEFISRRCLLVAVLLWPMCSLNGMPCRTHRTWHPTSSQNTCTWMTCRCAIHWCVNNGILEYTTTNFNVFGRYTHQQTLDPLRCPLPQLILHITAKSDIQIYWLTFF